MKQIAHMGMVFSNQLKVLKEKELISPRKREFCQKTIFRIELQHHQFLPGFPAYEPTLYWKT
jgi:hypothetical protein